MAGLAGPELSAWDWASSAPLPLGSGWSSFLAGASSSWPFSIATVIAPLSSACRIARSFMELRLPSSGSFSAAAHATASS